MKTESILILFIAFALCSCEKEAYNDPMPQPEVSLYEQMMLKGNVEEVTDVRKDTYTSVSIYRFDDNHNLTYHEYNGSVSDDFIGLRAEPYTAMHQSYAFFICPDTWTEKRDTVMSAYVAHDGVHKKIEYTWDESGKFTDIRCYINDTPIGHDGVYNMAEFLYHDNGYPRYRFIINADDISLDYQYSFSDFDKNGNPLTIEVEGPDENYSISRTIKYRK